jgi:prepilin-type N-terminal cleavage/methylation domain-containing protein
MFRNIKVMSADRQQSRPGFTLTEMLVAVTLLLVIMTIFAQIFQIAVTSMTKQKGMASNDQRTRTALSIIDADLKRMSYRPIEGHQGIVPLVPGIRYDGFYAAGEQRGYFYYSENNPDNDTDDVLQFTIDATLLGETKSSKRYAGQSQLPLYGKAATLLDAGGIARRDQPDWDDGVRDGISQSRWAEVAYFLRHGTLHRRVLLLRDTDDGVPFSMENIDRGNKRRLGQPGYRLDPDTAYDLMWDYTGNYYSDFDFSAHHDFSPYEGPHREAMNPSAPETVAILHSTLSNEPSTNSPLGVPHFRFGFYHANGLPREFITDGTANYFMGRFTHEETSHPNFRYPHQYAANHPYNLSFNAPRFLATGRLERADGQPGFINTTSDSRRGTDVVMGNVVGFDVKIWDESFGGFVDMGSPQSIDFANNRNTGYGTTNEGAIVSRNIFDTWHSIYDVTDGSVMGTSLQQIGNGRTPRVPLVITSGIADWQPDTLYNAGVYVRPSPAYRDPGHANAHERRHSRINYAVVYRCIETGWTAESPEDEPSWNTDVAITDTFSELNTAEDTSVVPPQPKTPARWQVFDNRKPIRAIQITIRYLDPLSDQLRQQTIVHSFNEQGL